jgi:YebC/PmpR family DNA-binding regulatory protein
MSGHSKWSTIKRKKGKADAERGRMFTRLIKEITVAAREGGSDPEANPRLRSAVAAAKAANMPQDNIKRGILKGTGELPGVSYESVTYEGYGPGGVALFLEVMTDNKNRAVADIRHILSKYGGNLGANGCVAWMFDKKGVVTVDLGEADEDVLLEAALEAGAEDMNTDSGAFEIRMDPALLDDVRQAIEDKGIEIASAEVTMLPQNTTRIESESDAGALLKMLEALEEHEDIQKVYTNFDMDEALLEKVAG